MVGTLTKGMSTRAWTLPGSEDAKFKRLDMEYKSWGNMTLNAAGMSKKPKSRFGAKTYPRARLIHAFSLRIDNKARFLMRALFL